MKLYTILVTTLLLILLLDTGTCAPDYIHCTEEGHTSEYFPHERNCTEYYECDHERAVLKSCQSGEHWNPNLNICDWPWAAGCKLTSDSLTARAREGSSICPSGPVAKCPSSDPAFSQFFPHPYDCEWFFHCSNGVAYCKQCPAGLHWNTDLNTCDWPWQAACTSEPPSGCPEPEGLSCPVPQPDHDVYFADPANCSSFYQCSSGVVIKQLCPPGYLFDRVQKICNDAEKVDCCNEVTTTPESEVTSGNPPPDPETSEESSEETNEDVSSSSSSEEDQVLKI